MRIETINTVSGMQFSCIINGQPWALSDTHVLLSRRLGYLGYVPRAVGKWHLGYYKKKFSPTRRGFLSHFGYWGGHEDYYSHTSQCGVR